MGVSPRATPSTSMVAHGVALMCTGMGVSSARPGAGAEGVEGSASTDPDEAGRSPSGCDAAEASGCFDGEGSGEATLVGAAPVNSGGPFAEAGDPVSVTGAGDAGTVGALRRNGIAKAIAPARPITVIQNTCR